MLSLGTSHSHPKDENIFNQMNRNSFSFTEAVFVFLKVSIGVGALKMGNAFKCGVILGVIVNTLIGLLSFYSEYLFTKVIIHYKKSTFEELWIEAFGHKSAWLCLAMTVISCIMILVFYIQFTRDSLITILDHLIPDRIELMHDIYFIMIFLFIILFIPISLVYSLKIISILSYIGMACIFFLAVHTIYWFVKYYIDFGFDPLHQMTLFKFDSTFLDCIGSLMTAYLIYPLCYPGVRHIHHLTPRKANYLFLIVTLVCWFLYDIFGIFGYLTLFNTNEGGVILDYYPQNTLVLVANIALFVGILFTTQNAMNPARYAIIQYIYPKEEIPYVVWITMGIALFLISIVLSTLKGIVSDALSSIGDALSPVLLFIIPPILYIKALKTTSIPNLIGSIIMILLGLLGTAYVFYSYFGA